jgi:hypothetical protein
MTSSPPDMGIMRASIGLTHMIIDEQIIIATNPETAPEALRKLSQSTDLVLRQAVAGNPNVPIDILWELLADCSNAIIENPVFSSIILTDPDWILNIPEPYLAALLKQQDIPSIFITASKKHKSALVVDAVLEGITSNPATTTEQLEAIVLTYDDVETWPVRHSNLRWVMRHHNIRIESLKTFAAQCNVVVRYELARYCFDENYKLPRHISRQNLLDEVLPILTDNKANDNIVHAMLLYNSLPKQSIQLIVAKSSSELQIQLAKLPWEHVILCGRKISLV